MTKIRNGREASPHNPWILKLQRNIMSKSVLTIWDSLGHCCKLNYMVWQQQKCIYHSSWGWEIQDKDIRRFKDWWRPISWFPDGNTHWAFCGRCLSTLCSLCRAVMPIMSTVLISHWLYKCPVSYIMRVRISI